MLEIVTHKHSSVFMPRISAIFVHLMREFCIKCFLHKSVNVKLVEESCCVVDVQPVIDGLAFAKYFHVVFRIDEVVQQNGVGSDYGVIIRATLLQTDEVSKHSFHLHLLQK